MRARDGELETFGEDGNEKGLLMKKREHNNRRPVSVPASPGLQRYRGEQQCVDE